MIIAIFKALQSTSAPQEQQQLYDRLFPIMYGDLRAEQAAFGPDDSCIDHINTLCIIIEQGMESLWQYGQRVNVDSPVCVQSVG